MEDGTVMVVVDPRAFIKWRELADLLEAATSIFEQAILAFTNGLVDLADAIQAAECQAEETQEKPKYGPATSSCSCLVFLQLDLLPYYTAGFE